MRKPKTIILGAGIAGLSAGVASGFDVFEAAGEPGGICSSYYLRPGAKERHFSPEDESYRFEIGGGHWIFGGDTLVHRFISSLAPVKTYARRSAVFFPDTKRYVPYPLQNHLSHLPPETILKALQEIFEERERPRSISTLYDWLESCFGKTLCHLFFHPFHRQYTANLWKEIAPQDAYKSPVEMSSLLQGAFSSSPPVGYNSRYLYPCNGLDELCRTMASRANVHYHKRLTNIDLKNKEALFEDGTSVHYDVILSTIPLNRVIQMADIFLEEREDPSNAVLVVNIGAKKGPLCPDYQWLYIPKSENGFHRVGFYSHVEESFLPLSCRKDKNRVAIYVEKAYLGSEKPAETEISNLCTGIVDELKQWKWIEEEEVVDPTWIEIAYTWSWPSSQWKNEALKKLEKEEIYQVGRYARWVFQGIAESVKEGLTAGSTLRNLLV